MTRTLSATLAALLVVIAAFFAAAPGFAAANRYASPNGTGTVCSAAAPCALTTAVQSAAAGDTVLLTSGTYPTADLKGGTSKVSCSTVSRNGLSCHAGKWPHGFGYAAYNQHGNTVRSAAVGFNGMAYCKNCRDGRSAGCQSIGTN